MKIAVAVAAAAVLGLVVAGLVWAKTYEPLTVAAYAPGYGMETKPTASEGRLLFTAKPGVTTFEMRFYLHNGGSLPVTVTGADRDGIIPPTGQHEGAWSSLDDLRQPLPAGSEREPSRAPFHELRIPAHGTAQLVVRARGRCFTNGVGITISHGGMTMHYRYGGVFARTQQVEWPFLMAFSCGKN